MEGGEGKRRKGEGKRGIAVDLAHRFPCGGGVYCGPRRRKKERRRGKGGPPKDTPPFAWKSMGNSIPVDACGPEKKKKGKKNFGGEREGENGDDERSTLFPPPSTRAKGGEKEKAFEGGGENDLHGSRPEISYYIRNGRAKARGGEEKKRGRVAKETNSGAECLTGAHVIASALGSEVFL